MEHYLAEISRILKRGGRFMATWFLLNDVSEQSIDEGKSAVEFNFRMDGYEENRVNDPFLPESAIAYPEYYIRELYRENELHVQTPIHYGSWCGRKHADNVFYKGFQDLITAVKN
jgi:hypothetical protein